MKPEFWFYFHSPFPKAEGFSAYRMPGLLVHVPVVLIFASLGAWLCANRPPLYPFFLLYAVLGVYLGRDIAILAHYNGLITIAVLVVAFFLVGALPTWPQWSSVASTAVTAIVAALFGWYVNWRAGMESKDTPALHWLIRSKNRKAIGRALEAGADPNEKDTLLGWEFAPLHVAVALPDKVDPAHVVAIIELLVRAGADLNALSYHHGTPLQLAVEEGKFAIVRALLGLGADPCRSGENDRTPLHAAVQRGERDIIEALLAAGADINAIGRGRNVLGEAAQSGHLELIPWLLDKGAKAEGETFAMTMLASSTDPRAVQLMQRVIDAGAQVADELLACAATPEMIRLLAAHGARIDRIPALKNPVFARGDAQTLAQRLRALRKLGADLTATDQRRQTVLHRMALDIKTAAELPAVLAEVLPAGLDINATDDEGKTAIYLLVEGVLPYVTGRGIAGLKKKLPVEAAITLLAPLLEAGADPRIATLKGEDAPALAKRLKAPKALRARLEQGAAPVPKA
jgi:cytohesin